MSETLPEPPLSTRHWLHDRAAQAIFALARTMPYNRRVAAMGWFGRNILGPLVLNRRIRANLRQVLPGLSRAETRAICRSVGDNFGRLLGEFASGAEFARFAATMPMRGPGLAALEQARAEGRPVLLASAHFGNYDVVRGGLGHKGYRIGGLYKPMRNPASNRRYLAMIGEIGQPLFPSGTAGLADMVRFLRSGGMLGVLTDVHAVGGVAMDFVGRPALTALSAAKLALKYDALLLPVYARRNPDGLTFDVEFEDPIPHSDPETMTQALNDSISARIRATPGQWFWVHRRWKA